MYQILLRYSPYFKHCKYRRENEQRLIIVQDENSPIYKVAENGKKHISVPFDKLQIELKDYEDGR